MRSRTASDLPGRCHRCYIKLEFCLCASIVPIETRTQVLVIRHAWEAWKTTNTARIAALALPNLRLLEYTGRDDREALAQSFLPGARLVFPEPQRSAEGGSTSVPLVRGAEPQRSAEGGSTSVPLVRGAEPQRSAEGGSTSVPRIAPPTQLVVLDGTWRQARRMLSSNSLFARLPRLSLPPPPPGVERLRDSPHPEGVSTIEAIAGALRQVEGEGPAVALERLHRRMVDSILAARGAKPRDSAIVPKY
jgi:DTW domain-containing protein YfiP